VPPASVVAIIVNSLHGSPAESGQFPLAESRFFVFPSRASWSIVAGSQISEFVTPANSLSDRYGKTMLKLRKLLCWCFGFVSLNFLVISAVMIPRLLTSIHQHGFSASPHHRELSAGAALIFAVLSGLVLALPLVLAIVYGAAWWTVKRGKRSARAWAIVASLAMLLLSIPLMVAAFYAVLYAPRGFAGILILAVLVLALGVAGLVAFAQPNSMDQAIGIAKPMRIAGDGTSWLVDGLAWIVGFGGYIGGRYLWVQWGRTHGILLHRSSSSLVLLVAALLLTVFLHESGHALTGLALGMKLRMFVVGPFQWRIRDGRWTFKFILAQFFSAGGATAVVPTNPWQPRWREICMIAAGPLANLVTGLIAGYAAIVAKGQPYEPYWSILTIFSTLSLVTFVVNLIPFRPEAAYSDGARIYQLLGGGPWADLHRAISVAASSMVTPLRPKDYDIDAIQRAELSFTQGHQALLLRLLASSYFLDCGMISQASGAVTEAEQICKESTLDIPAELCMAFVYRTAFLRRDATGARQWWERMEAKKPTHRGVDYWLAKSALGWIEGCMDEAREAWEKGNLLAQRLPAAGDYEFDRYRCSLLHDCIESTEPSLAS